MSQKQVSIKISADSKNAEKNIDGISKKLNDLKKSLSTSKAANLGASISGLGVAFSATSKAVGAVVNALSECNEAYKVQEKAEKSLEVAARNNPYLDGKSVAALKNYASELQSISNYGDEQLLPLMTKLAASGRTQEQIMQIMSASVDMAASGAVSLDEAVSGLNKTFAGEAGRLSALSPKIKDLTQEQLRNGEAVRLLAQQYKGMAKETADTGTQMKNAIGDVKEMLGDVVHTFLTPIQESATSILSTITGWYQNIKNYNKAYDDAIAKARELADVKETIAEREEREKKEAKEQAKEDKRRRQILEDEATLRKAAIDEYVRVKSEANLLEDHSVEQVKELTERAYEYASAVRFAYGDSESINMTINRMAKEMGITVDQAKSLLVTTGELTAETSNLAAEYRQASHYASLIGGYKAEAAKKEAEEAEKKRKKEEAERKKAASRSATRSAAPKRTKDDARREYDEAVAKAAQEIELRRSVGEEISAEAEAQKMLNTATDAYIKMMGDPTFKGDNGSGKHEAEARRYIEELSSKMQNDAARKKWDEASEIAKDEAQKIREEFSKQLEEFDRAYTDFINTLPEGSEERLTAEKTFTDGVIKLHEEMEAKLKELDEKSAKDAENAAKAKEEAFRKTVEAIAGYTTQVSQIASDAGALMIQSVQNESQLEQAELKEKYENGLLSEEEYEERLEDIKKDAAKKQYRIQMAQWAMQVAQATASVAMNILSAMEGATTLPGKIAAAALAGAAGAVQLASVVAAKPVAPAFAKGGFVPGKSYTGDRVTARVNSGEAVLTAAQQRNFMALANGERGGSGTQINVTNNAANLVDAKPSFDGKAVSILIEQKVNEGLQKGKFNKSLVIANQSMNGKGYGV